jgi:hypothetical protein
MGPEKKVLRHGSGEGMLRAANLEGIEFVTEKPVL